MSATGPAVPGTGIASASSTDGLPPAAIFIVLRRMRLPLIVLIVVFAISVLGLTLIEGDSPEGPWRMSVFDAFYFMSYTATTIGFGEIPRAFNDAQRLWVTFSIYVSVVTWAYAIGTMLAQLQDPGFKRTMAMQRFRRRVGRIREPFWLMVGFGQTGELLGSWIDALGHRFVAIDLLPERITAAELGAFQADVPALAADARDPTVLTLAGLRHSFCQGVLALTDDDEANLAVLMAASVLRPDATVLARASDRALATRMRAFGTPVIINPFDSFGDHFSIELRAPAVERLAHWLMSAPGAPMPDRHHAIGSGHWVLCGYGRFGTELVADLRAAQVEVIVIDPAPVQAEGVEVLRGDGTDPHVLAQARISQAAGFVAGTDNDITNLSLVEAARRLNPSVFIVGRQNRPMNAELFAAMDLDLTMVPSRVVAEEALAHIGTPRLGQFLRLLSGMDDDSAASLTARIVDASGHGSPDLWVVTLAVAQAPALLRAMDRSEVTVADLLRNPVDREHALPAVALMLARGEQAWLSPDLDAPVHQGDTLLFAGTSQAQTDQQSVLYNDEATSYVLTGQHVPASWVLRRLQGVRRN